MHKEIEISNLELREIYDLMISGISPRPIAFVGTQDKTGNDNLAPFSYFNAFGSNPPIVGFSPANSGRTGKQKDTLINIRSTKEFSISMINYDMVEQVSLSSCEFESKIDEFVKSGLTKKESSKIKPYSVNESYFIMECKLHKILELGGNPGSGNLVLGEIVNFHISPDILDKDNKIDPVKLDPISRLGYNYYSRSRDGFFQIHKPKHNGIGFDGLPELLRTSDHFTGNELAKLAGVKSLPEIEIEFDYLDSLSSDNLILKVKESLLNMDLEISWQAALRLIK